MLLVLLGPLDLSKPPAGFEGHPADITAAAITPDGKLLVTGDSQGTLKVWNVPEGSEVFNLEGHEGPLISLSIGGQPGAWLLASASSTKALRRQLNPADQGQHAPPARHIRVWDLQTGKLAQTLPPEETAQIYSIAISPDGRQMVMSQQSIVEAVVWDTDTGQQLSTRSHVGLDRTSSGSRIVNPSFAFFTNDPTTRHRPITRRTRCVASPRYARCEDPRW